MAVVGWFLCFPAFFFFFFWKKGFFFPYAIYDKKNLRDLHQKKKKFRRKKTATYAKKIEKATDAYFHNRATLSS